MIPEATYNASYPVGIEDHLRPSFSRRCSDTEVLEDPQGLLCPIEFCIPELDSVRPEEDPYAILAGGMGGVALLDLTLFVFY